jgi:hypothetical protein
MNTFNIYEAYAAVYDEDLREDLLAVEEDFSFIDDLSDNELEEIVEEVIYDLLDEGYSINDVDLIFESQEIYDEILCEATITSDETRDTSGGAKVTSGTGTRRVAAGRLARMKAGQKITRQKERKERIQGAISRVKSGIKGAIKSGVSAARSVVDKPARKYAEKRGVVPSKSGKSSLGSGEGIGSVKFKQQTSAGRREVRSRVAGDIASRIKGKVQRGAGKAVEAGQKAVGAVKSSSDTAQSKMRAAGSEVKKGAKGLVAGAARAVSRGARDVARRLGEDVDLYDVVLEHLLDEGFADTEEAATVIMANMSEEWREEILEQQIVRTGTSTNAAGKQINWTHRHNTATGRSTVSDNGGEPRELPRQRSAKIPQPNLSVKQNSEKMMKSTMKPKYN